MTNQQKIELVLSDLEGWLQCGGNESDDSMVYAFENGYPLHAADLWMGTGAMSENVDRQVQGIKINRRAETREIRQLLKEAFIYICPDCNHHGFHAHDEGDSISCFSCLKTAFKDPK